MPRTEGAQGGGSLCSSKPCSAGWWGDVHFWLALLCKLAFVALAISNVHGIWRVAEPTLEVTAGDKTCSCPIDFDKSVNELVDRAKCSGGDFDFDTKSAVTFRYPLYSCDAPKLTLSGTHGTFDTADEKCSLAWFLVAATEAGNFFAVVAVLVFVTVDFLSRRPKWEARCTRSMVTGMGCFLIFILMQCAASTAALAKQYGTFIDNTNAGLQAQGYKDSKVEGFASKYMLYATAGVAGAVALLTLVEGVMACCGGDRAQQKKEAAADIQRPLNATSASTGDAW